MRAESRFIQKIQAEEIDRKYQASNGIAHQPGGIAPEKHQ